VPSACGLAGRLTQAPLQLVRFGYIISYNALNSGTARKVYGLAGIAA
jgi:hypothetical protein